MSRIIDKPFNPAQRIIRAIFKGSPNLFTTSDLNRQIEAFDYRLKQLERKVGVITDMVFEWDSNDNYVAKYSYLEYNGCILCAGTPTTFIIGRSIDHFRALGLLITEREIDYTGDSTHLISGVKFEDGTSRPAANHKVVQSYQLVLAHYTTHEGDDTWSWDNGVTGVQAILCELLDHSGNTDDIICGFVHKKFSGIRSYVDTLCKDTLYNSRRALYGFWSSNPVFRDGIYGYISVFINERFLIANINCEFNFTVSESQGSKRYDDYVPFTSIISNFSQYAQDYNWINRVLPNRNEFGTQNKYGLYICGNKFFGDSSASDPSPIWREGSIGVTKSGICAQVMISGVSAQQVGLKSIRVGGTIVVPNTYDSHR